MCSDFDTEDFQFLRNRIKKFQTSIPQNKLHFTSKYPLKYQHFIQTIWNIIVLKRVSMFSIAQAFRHASIINKNFRKYFRKKLHLIEDKLKNSRNAYTALRQFEQLTPWYECIHESFA